MSKRERDEPDPLIEALRARDAAKSTKVKAWLKEHYPNPSAAHVEETVKCIEDMAMRKDTNEAEGNVRVCVRLQTEDRSQLIIIPELAKDRWWNSIFAWNEAQKKRYDAETPNAVVPAELIYQHRMRQFKLILRILFKTWYAKHPDNATMECVSGELIVTISLK